MLKEWLNGDKNSYQDLAVKVYGATSLDDSKATMNILNKPAAELITDLKNQQVILLYQNILKTYQTQVQANINGVQARINKLNRDYMQAQIDVFKEKAFYPDANSTLRLTYGQVKGFNPRDAVKYDYYTYLDGVMDKYKPGDYEFDVPKN